MKKPLLLLPLVCSLSLLTSCATTSDSSINAGNGVEIKPFTRLRHSSQQASNYYQLGRYYQGQSRLEKAAKAYRQALEIDSNHIEAQSSLGKIYARQGKFDEAIVVFKSLIDAKPSIAKPYNNLGYTYYLQGKYAEAIATFETALTLAPQSTRTWNNISAAFHKSGSEQKSHQALAHASALNNPKTPSQPQAVNHADKPDAPSPAKSSYLPTLQVKQIGNTGTEKIVKNISHAPTSLSRHLPAYTVKTVSLTPTATQQPEVLPEMAANKIFSLQPLNLLALVEPNSKTINSGVTLKNAVHANQTRGHKHSLVKMPSFKLEIANGNGVTGMAKRTSHVLTRMGLPSARLTNIKPFQQTKTIIRYRVGHLKHALFLQKQLEGRPVLMVHKRLDQRTDVQLVLGKDVSRKVAAYRTENAAIKVTSNMRTPSEWGFES